MPHHDDDASERWKHDGVHVIKGDQLNPNAVQTPGMFRQAAINHARVGVQNIWVGTVAIEPNAKTGVHHHGALESVIFVVRGKARMRWDGRLEYVAEAGPVISYSCRLRPPSGNQCRPQVLGDLIDWYVDDNWQFHRETHLSLDAQAGTGLISFRTLAVSASGARLLFRHGVFDLPRVCDCIDIDHQSSKRL